MESAKELEKKSSSIANNEENLASFTVILMAGPLLEPKMIIVICLISKWVSHEKLKKLDTYN